MMKADAAQSMKTIFKKYQPMITNPEFLPNTPVETLLSRITAVWFLQSDNPAEVIISENFIKATSTLKDNDLARLKDLATKIQHWNHIEICSTYKNNLGSFIEYKLNVDLIKSAQTIIHRHALYQERDGKYYFISQTPPLVRILGDAVLHKAGKFFPDHASTEELAELHRQIALAKTILIQTSGAGIAANQCADIANPYQFAIIGVFNENAAHIEGVKRRYPNVIFPAAMIMVNPKIINCSKATQFFMHACLSVPIPSKCQIQSPTEITIAYLDPTKDMQSVEVTLKGIDAVVAWHEMNHILAGKTYIDTALTALEISDKKILKQMITKELTRRLVTHVIPELTVPPFHFIIKIDEKGLSRLDQSELNQALPKFTLDTLQAFLNSISI